MQVAKRIVTSANWDDGRNGRPINGIVLHTMVGFMQGSEATFNDPNKQVSVHYGVGMDGSIRQWVDEGDTAYQAGNYAVNLTTIGIEHEDYAHPYDSTRTAALYESSSDLVADICRRYNFPADSSHIFLHKDVIDKTKYPGGTACPAGLDTNKIIALAAAKLQGDVMTNDGDVVNLYNKILGRQPSAEDIAIWTNRPFKDVTYGLIGSEEYAQRIAHLADAPTAIANIRGDQLNKIGTALGSGAVVDDTSFQKALTAANKLATDNAELQAKINAINNDPDKIIITKKGFGAVWEALKSFFNKNN